MNRPITLTTACLLAALTALPSAAQTMIPYETGRGWGYKDAGGNVIVKAQYDAVSRPADGLGLVCIKNKWGAVNSKGETVIPVEYDYVDLCNEGFVAVYEGPVRESDGTPYMAGGEWRFMDLAGTAGTSRPFGTVGPFVDGVAWAEESGTGIKRQRRAMPIVDKKGKPVGQEYIFGVSATFSMDDMYLTDDEGKTMEVPDGRWILLDRSYNTLTENTYDAVGEFSEGLAWVRRDGKYGFVNTLGQEVIPAIYESVQGAPGSRHGSLLLHPETGAVRWVTDRSGRTAWLNEKGETVIGFTDSDGRVSLDDTVDENMWDF